MKYVFILFLVASVVYSQDTVIQDKLEWQDDSKTTTIKRDWHLANKHCKELSLGGRSDWRLPSVSELYSIIDVKNFEPAIKREFKNCKNNYYWSKSEYASDENYAWYVYFGSGSTNRNSKSSDFFVRCVRDK